MLFGLFGRSPKVIQPWSQRGFKGRHRGTIPGRHRKPVARGGGFLVPGKRQTPRDDRIRFYF